MVSVHTANRERESSLRNAWVFLRQPRRTLHSPWTLTLFNFQWIGPHSFPARRTENFQRPGPSAMASLSCNKTVPSPLVSESAGDRGHRQSQFGQRCPHQHRPANMYYRKGRGTDMYLRDATWQWPLQKSNRGICDHRQRTGPQPLHILRPSGADEGAQHSCSREAHVSTSHYVRLSAFRSILGPTSDRASKRF